MPPIQDARKRVPTQRWAKIGQNGVGPSFTLAWCPDAGRAEARPYPTLGEDRPEWVGPSFTLAWCPRYRTRAKRVPTQCWAKSARMGRAKFHLGLVPDQDARKRVPTQRWAKIGEGTCQKALGNTAEQAANWRIPASGGPSGGNTQGKGRGQNAGNTDRSRSADPTRDPSSTESDFRKGLQ